MIVLTYLIETPGNTEALAAKIASDQSTGTFVELPGETPELKARVAARVLDVRQLEPTKTPSLPDVPGNDLSIAPRPISGFRSRRSAPTFLR